MNKKKIVDFIGVSPIKEILFHEETIVRKKIEPYGHIYKYSMEYSSFDLLILNIKNLVKLLITLVALLSNGQ